MECTDTGMGSGRQGRAAVNNAPPDEQDTHCIRLRPLPGATNLPRFKQDHANGMTQIDLRDLLPQDRPSVIVDVRLDGTVHKHRVADSGHLTVSPLVPLEGGYLVVRYLCPRKAPQEPPRPRQRPRATSPAPDLSYGLTAPAPREARGSR